jgi:hypothetical protein
VRSGWLEPDSAFYPRGVWPHLLYSMAAHFPVMTLSMDLVFRYVKKVLFP